MTLRYRQNDQIFTKITVVQYLLDEVGFVAHQDLSNIKLLEPASGDGNFAIEVIERLYNSSQKFQFDFIQALNSNIRFVELVEKNIKRLKDRVEKLLKKLGYNVALLESKVFICGNYLTMDSLPKFNVIVGNPPYIRHELIEKDLRLLYREKFSAFRYRADLYIPFYEHSLNLLLPKGKLSFVCSNRWLYNQYGKPLREQIATDYHLEKLLNLEKSKLFGNQTIAYSTITTICNQKAKQTLYYESRDRKIDFENIVFTKKKSPKDGAWQNLFVDYDLKGKGLKSIEEQGFKIGIGVATGADGIFIIKKSQNIDIEKSRLMPLLKSNALKGKNIEWDGSYIINPYQGNELCDLKEYPKLKAYFEKHKKQLQKRHTAKKNPLKWYKTIDKIKPDLLHQPKLLLPDLATSKKLHIDRGDFYPHHNLYYITHNDVEKLEKLASILMSDFVKQQLQQIGIKMNGGVARFQAQTLRKLYIPTVY